MVQFSSDGSRDPDPGDSISYAWDFDNDGTVDSIDPGPTHTYTANGYTAKLTVTDSSGKSESKTTIITVGNTAPELTIQTPVDGTFFEWGDTIPFTVTGTDAEDGGYIAGGISVTYSDDGANGQPPLSTTVQHLVQTHRQEVEFAQRQEGTVVGTSYLPSQSPFREGLSAGDWMALNNRYDTGIATSVTASVNACGTEVGVPVGALDVRADAPDGPLMATLPVEVNDTFQYCQFVPTFTSVTASIDLDGVHEVYLVPVAVDGGPTEDYFRLDWVQFNEAP